VHLLQLLKINIWQGQFCALDMHGTLAIRRFEESDEADATDISLQLEEWRSLTIFKPVSRAYFCFIWLGTWIRSKAQRFSEIIGMTFGAHLLFADCRQ
jgi:hypothetical protein